MTITKLAHRTLIEIKGADARTFLQGLTTNDMMKLGTTIDSNELMARPSLYTTFLNPQGRFLTDTFVLLMGPDCVWLDVEAAHADALFKKLMMYRLRSAVTLSQQSDVSIYAVFDENSVLPGTYIHDARHPDMGKRYYTETALNDAQEELDTYDRKRFSLLIPDGTRDIPYERGFIMEYGFDRMGAVDFQKGCYVGQELTARMHYRKLGKRQLACVWFAHEAPEAGTEITRDGAPVGVVCSRVENMALVHMRTEALEALTPIDAPDVPCGFQLFKGNFNAGDKDILKVMTLRG